MPASAAARAIAADMQVDIISAGVDSWGVDYGLVDARGQLTEEPICYRDGRTSDDVWRTVFARVPRDELFGAPASRSCRSTPRSSSRHTCARGCRAAAARLLLIPDLCHHLLCGSLVTEITNASTTGLLAAGPGAWDDELFTRLSLPRPLMPDIVAPGRFWGRYAADCTARAGWI